MAKFRSDRKRLPLHPLEKAVLIILSLHVCLLPWAIGSMRAFSLAPSLALGLAGLIVALLPRNYTAAYTGGPDFRLSTWPKLLKFPLFWIGLALLAYVALQGFNPSHVWMTNGKVWWARPVEHLTWLPTGVDAPFDRFNVWRQLIIYTSAWLVLCTVWVGLTRKRSLQIFVTILVTNGVLLSLVGFAQNMFSPRAYPGLPPKLLWFYTAPQTSFPFATFVGHNHAGAYLALMVGCAVMIAVYLNDRRVLNMKKSSPASLLIMAGLLFAAAILVAMSRGAVLTLVLFSVGFGLWCWARGRLQSGPRSNRAVTYLVLALFVGVGSYAFHQVDFSRMENKILRLVKDKDKEASAMSRTSAHRAAAEMLGDHWQRGVGAGSFRHLFPAYVKKHPDIYQNGKIFWDHAHNDWLEIPIELGLTGCLILLSGAGFVIVFLYRHRRGWPSPAIVLLLGAGQTLMHAWFDFPFQNPAILTTWLALIVLSLRWLEFEAAAGGGNGASAAS